MCHLRSALGCGQWAMGCELALRLLPRYILAVAVADGAAFCYLAGELRALEAQLDALVERARRYLAELIVSGDTTLLFIRAGALCHARAFLTSDSAYAYFHVMSPVFLFRRLNALYGHFHPSVVALVGHMQPHLASKQCFVTTHPNQGRECVLLYGEILNLVAALVSHLLG